MGRPKYIDEQISQRIGSIRSNKDGIQAICIDYKDYKNITVKFINHDCVCNMRWDHFNNGNFSLPKEYTIKNRIGTTISNKNGYTAKCVSYNNSNDISIDVNGIIIPHVGWGNFISGKFKINKYGAYQGEKSKTNNDRKPNKEYETWMSMLKRCYSQSVKNNRPTYSECRVCDQWMNYDNFYNWITQQPNYLN